MNKYKKITTGKGVQQDEHRYAMEKHLGRSLTPVECVHHINGDRADNRIGNLSVVSRSEHAKIHMTEKQKARCRQMGKDHAKSGEYNSQAKLTGADVVVIRRELRNGAIGAYLAVEYGVSESCISSIKTRRKWKHIP